MRALCWHGKDDVREDTVPDPKIEHPAGCHHQDCGPARYAAPIFTCSAGIEPTMESGDILGHENMGEVIELGSEVSISIKKPPDLGGFLLRIFRVTCTATAPS